MLKRKKTNKQSSNSFGDVTINDFANAVVIKDRQKKSSSNVKKESDKAWDEIDDDKNFDFVREENEDGTSVVVLRKQSEIDKKDIKNNWRIDNVRTGNLYPLDIWFLISEYIPPQDVGRFAGICKDTHSVACSAKFWFNLYKRFYKYSPSLPIHLEPDHVVRLYGLRTCVIRALYFMHPPFVNNHKIAHSTKHPGALINKQCLSAFHKHGFDSIYCFKFKEYTPPNTLNYHNKFIRCKANAIDMLEDVMANPDEHCCVLLVNCRHFVPIPCVEGLILKSALLTLSHGLRQHRLQLEFSARTYSTLGGSDSTSIVLDPVLGVKILDWWDPQYPYNHNFKYPLADKDESDEDESANCESFFNMI